MENQNQDILYTGYKSLDECIGGIRKGDYIVIGSWPGEGKSAFALNLISKLLDQEKKVGFFSLQMSAEEVTHRLICCGSNVKSNKVYDGSLDDEEFERVQKYVDKLQSNICIIEDSSSLTSTELREKAEEMMRDYNVEILFIDYIGYLQSDIKRQTYYEEMQEISKSIKRLAKDLKIPVVVLCQLTRESEKEREERNPNKTDIRDSSQIEADASAIILLEKSLSDNNFFAFNVRVVKNARGCVKKFEFGFSPEMSKFMIVEWKNIGKINF